MKIKPLLPSLREKKRYLAYQILSEAKINKSALSAIENGIKNFIGELGVAKAGVTVMRDLYDETKQSGVIKTGHKYVDQIKAALALITTIGGSKVIVRSTGVSGILKKVKEGM